MPTLLLVEDEAVLAKNLVKAFAGRGLDVRHAPSVAEAKRLAADAPPDVALVDLRLPDGSGLDVLSALVQATPDVPVVMMTAYGSVADAVEAMKRGAIDFVLKPLDLEEIRLKVDRALGTTRERRVIAYYRCTPRAAVAAGRSSRGTARRCPRPSSKGRRCHDAAARAAA